MRNPWRRLRSVGAVVLLVAVAGCRATSEEGASTSTLVSTSVVPTSPSTSAAPTTTEPPAFDPYAGAAPASPATGEVSDDWIGTPDGYQRHYRLYVPSSLDPDAPVPLLVALHGGLGSSDQFAVNSGFDELAESNGFIVVYPDGIRAISARPGLQTWNGGYCCGPAARKNVDDVGYVRTLIDLLSERFPIDPDRVVVAGHSNGAIMAYRLACELSDRVVAIGVQAGSLGVDVCEPTDSVSVLHVHGLADTNHPIDGGAGTGVSGVVFRSGRAAVQALADANGCDATPIVETVPSNADLEVSTWSECRSGAVVRLLTVEGASHAWMGHAGASSASTGLVGEPYMELDASRAIWSFLAEHSRE